MSTVSTEKLKYYDSSIVKEVEQKYFEEIKNLKERLVKVRTETRIDMGMEIDEWKKVAEGS